MPIQPIFKSIAKPLAGTALALISAASSLAQETPQVPKWDTSAIIRINTKLGDNGSCRQILPNTIVTTKSKDWTFSGALKIDNLEAADGCFGDHGARLFFGNATYKGWQDHGTTIKAGMFSPFELARAPLSKGFTYVALDEAHQLYGGIAGIKLYQNILKTDKSLITLNGGIGTKPDLFERFGPTSDSVVFGGFDASHRFSDKLHFDGRYKHIAFDQGSDDFVFGRLQYDGAKADFGLYGEMTNGSREFIPGAPIKTDRYTVMGEMITPLSTKTDWQIAAGLVDGNTAVETSLYHQITKDLRGTIGAGHDFDANAQTVRIGLLQKLDF